MKRRRTLRLAVGGDEAFGLLPDGRSRCLPAGTPQELADALTEWREACAQGGADPAAVAFPTHVACCLLPPLCDVRTVDVPPLGRTDTTNVLTRHAARYFPTARGDQLVAWSRPGRGRKTPGRVLAAAVSATAVESLMAALREAGFEVGDPIPAHGAWVAAAAASGGRAREGAAVVTVRDRVVAVGFRRGAATEALTFPLSGVDRAFARAALMAGKGELVVIGEDGAADAETARRIEEDPVAVAARFADRRTLNLVPEARKAERAGRETRQARALWAAAVVFALIAGAMGLLGTQRELSALRSARAAIAGDVTGALEVRQALEEVRAPLLVVDSIQRSMPSRTWLLADLAGQLPDSAHVLRLRVDGDSVLQELAQ